MNVVLSEEIPAGVNIASSNDRKNKNIGNKGCDDDGDGKTTAAKCRRGGTRLKSARGNFVCCFLNVVTSLLMCALEMGQSSADAEVRPNVRLGNM